MPRPIAKLGDTLRPVPWSQANEWGVADIHRKQMAIVQGRCLVCGEVVQKGVVFVRTVTDNLVAPSSPTVVKETYDINDLKEIGIVVEGSLHTNCAKLTRAHCRPVQERLRDKIYVERPYIRGRFKYGTKPTMEFR